MDSGLAASRRPGMTTDGSTSAERALNRESNQRRAWHRNSGLPEFRTIGCRKSGKPRLAVTSPAMAWGECRSLRRLVLPLAAIVFTLQLTADVRIRIGADILTAQVDVIAALGRTRLSDLTVFSSGCDEKGL